MLLPKRVDFGDPDDSAAFGLHRLLIVLLEHALDVPNGVLAGALVRNQSRLCHFHRRIFGILPIVVGRPPVPHLDQFEPEFSVNIVHLIMLLTPTLGFHMRAAFERIHFLF
jgi:hypothetical protein